MGRMVPPMSPHTYDPVEQSWCVECPSCGEHWLVPEVELATHPLQRRGRCKGCWERVRRLDLVRQVEWERLH